MAAGMQMVERGYRLHSGRIHSWGMYYRRSRGRHSDWRRFGGGRTYYEDLHDERGAGGGCQYGGTGTDGCWRWSCSGFRAGREKG